MEMGWTKLLGDAFATLRRQEDWALRVIGRSQKDANVIIEVIVKERPLHDAMVDFAWRIFLLSLLISLITAALVYFSLQWFMVRLMRRLTDNIVGFREDPVDASRASHPSKRPDEIGVAERELAAMQNVRTVLCQKTHLATGYGCRESEPRFARHPVLCAARLGLARRQQGPRREKHYAADHIVDRACCVAVHRNPELRRQRTAVP